MITFDEKQQCWTLDNGGSLYQIGLRNGQCHHIGYLPIEHKAKLKEVNVGSTEELQPEMEIQINYEGRIRHHGVRWNGCACSNRAIYTGYWIAEEKDKATLVLENVDPETGLHIDCHYTIYHNSPAIHRHVELINASEKPVEVQHLASFCLYGMPWFSEGIPGENLLIHWFPSSWCWEGQTRTITAEEAGLFNSFNLGSWHLENTGSWSSKEAVPFFIIEEKEAGVLWGVQIEHSGSWRFEISGPGPGNGRLQMQGGLGNYTYAHWSKTLAPGESYTSANVSLCCVAGKVETMISAMHHHRSNILVNHSQADMSLPIIFNEWNSTQGDICEDTVVKHLEGLQQTGIEVYVMDAGWYMEDTRGKEPGGWFKKVGDWDPHPSRFPTGLGATVEKITAAGMIAGIWMEIEVAGTESSAFEQNTRMFMTRPGGFVEDNFRRFLYFGSPETRAYADEAFERLIQQGIRYFKIDYNVDCGAGCTNNGSDLGEGLVEHVRGYYKWLEELRARHPDVIIENCSSGGNRLDYGMLARTDLASITDQSDWKRLGCVLYGVTRYVLPTQAGNWCILKEHFTDREMCFALINTMLGRMHVSGNLEKLAKHQISLLSESVAFYKDWRSVLLGGSVYHHTPNPSLQEPKGWMVLQITEPEGKRGLMGAWRLKDSDASQTVSLKGICDADSYRVCSFPKGESFAVSGVELANGFVINLPQEFSAVLFGFEKE